MFSCRKGLIVDLIVAWNVERVAGAGLGGMLPEMKPILYGGYDVKIKSS